MSVWEYAQIMSDISNTPFEFDFELSDSGALELISGTLARRLDQWESDCAKIPICTNKWVLSSALQKLIRRGRPAQAIAVAVRLFQLDPGYLPRRLPIIAVEDVGLGDLTACHDVLALCSSTRWWRSSAYQTIGFLVDSLARAVKCRAACDAYCLSQVADATPFMMRSLLKATQDELVQLVVDRERPRLDRCNALRVIGGITARYGGTYQVLSRYSAEGLDRVARALDVPPLVRWVMARHPRTAGLAAMLPIALEASEARSVVAGGDFPHSLDLVEGIPHCAVDMFSGVGRSVLRDFFGATRSIKDFANENIRRGCHIRLLNMALFHAESSHLNHYLTSPGLKALRDETEQAEMIHLGMMWGGIQRHDLYSLLEAEAPALAHLRRVRLEAMHEISE